VHGRFSRPSGARNRTGRKWCLACEGAPGITDGRTQVVIVFGNYPFTKFLAASPSSCAVVKTLSEGVELGASVFYDMIPDASGPNERHLCGLSSSIASRNAWTTITSSSLHSARKSRPSRKADASAWSSRAASVTTPEKAGLQVPRIHRCPRLQAKSMSPV